MREPAGKKPNASFKVCLVLAAFVLSLGNSALFYFVIWDMMTPTKPLTVVLFVISGSAHLVYFFLPWFVRDMFGPIFTLSTVNTAHYGSRGPDDYGDESSFFVKLTVQFGMALCLLTLALWLAQSGLLGGKKGPSSLITEANCRQIGGELRNIAGTSICMIGGEAEASN